MKLKVPNASSAGLRNVFNVENVRPVVVGACGVPVPSIQLSFCIQEMANWPAAEELKMALFGAVAVSCREMDWMDHWPTPNWLSKVFFTLDRLNSNTL